MVRNPIYDGPVYESVQPRFETPTKKTQNPSQELNAILTSPTSFPGDSPDHDHTSLLDNSNDETRYVCKPRRMSVPIMNSRVPLPYMTPSESRHGRDNYRRECQAFKDKYSPPTGLVDSDCKAVPVIDASFNG